MRQPVVFDDNEVVALCDSASPRCVRCASTLTPDDHLRLLPYDGPNLVGANQLPLPILGTLYTTLVIQTISYNVPFIVCRSLAVQLLVGWDFMRRHIDYINPQAGQWQCTAGCPPHLDSYTDWTRYTHWTPPPSPTPSDSSCSSAHTVPAPPPGPHVPGPCFSDLAEVMYHFLPPHPHATALSDRITAWREIFTPNEHPVMVLIQDAPPLVKLECSESFDDSSPEADSALLPFSRNHEFPMQCPLCTTWGQPFAVCNDCASRLGAFFGGQASTATRAAFAMVSQHPLEQFNADDELAPPPPLIRTNLLRSPGHYATVLNSAAACLSSQSTFDVHEF